MRSQSRLLGLPSRYMIRIFHNIPSLYPWRLIFSMIFSAFASVAIAELGIDEDLVWIASCSSNIQIRARYQNQFFRLENFLALKYHSKIFVSKKTNINSHVFILSNVAFVFLKFVFSIRFNHISKMLIQLRNLHLTLKIQFWNDNVPGKTMTNISRSLPEMILKHQHTVTYSIDLNLENYLCFNGFSASSIDSDLFGLFWIFILW